MTPLACLPLFHVLTWRSTANDETSVSQSWKFYCNRQQTLQNINFHFGIFNSTANYYEHEGIRLTGYHPKPAAHVSSMASFLQADLPSDDEADEDFNPEEGNSQASRDVEDAKAGRLGLGKKGESAHGKAARRERVDALWQQLNAGNGKKAKLDGATAKVQPDTVRSGMLRPAPGRPNG